MQDIKSQLAEELADIEWSDLVPHAQRDALIVVNESLNLVDCLMQQPESLQQFF